MIPTACENQVSYSFALTQLDLMWSVFLFVCSSRVVFADFFVMNLILWGEGSSAAMPFGTLVAILALWFCISVPLTFIGAYFGFKKSVSFFF